MFASLVVTVLNRFLLRLGRVVKENKTPNNELPEQSFGSTNQEELGMGNTSPDDTTVETQQSLTQPSTQQWTPTNPEVFAENMAQLEKVLAPLRKVWENAPTNAWIKITHRCFSFNRYVARYKDNGCEIMSLQHALKEDLNELFTVKWQHPKGLRHGAKTPAFLRKEAITEEQLELNLQELERQENPASSNEASFELDLARQAQEEFNGAEFSPEYQEWYRENVQVQHADLEDSIDADQHLLLWRQQQENNAANAAQKAEAERVKSLVAKEAILSGEIEDNASLVTTLIKRRESLQERIDKLRIEGYSLAGKMKTVLAKETVE